ncbi:MAG: TIGR03619 family F420-dependent LLM class oxidoreductase [Nocardioidaceae bacterium]
MRLGFALPHVGPVAARDNVRAVAKEAETLGYDSLWTLERLLKPVRAKTPYPATPDGQLNAQYQTVYEHLSVLTYAAAITSRVRLGVSVLNLPYHHPVTLAKRIATMDQLSGGRLVLGIGLGWSEDEADATNIPFRERGKVGEEAIGVLKALWAPDPVEFHGTYFNVPQCEFGPKPAQYPHPPLLIGGFASVALQRAGRLADGFTGCCASVDLLLDFKSQFEQAAREAGRDPTMLPTVIRCLVQLSDKPIADEGRPVATGTWEQVRDDVRRLQEGGVDEVFFDVSFLPDNTDRSSVLGYLERFRGIAEAPVRA